MKGRQGVANKVCLCMALWLQTSDLICKSGTDKGVLWLCGGGCLPTGTFGKRVCGELSPDSGSSREALWGAVSRQRPWKGGLWGAVSRQRPLERWSVGSGLPTEAFGKEACGELSPDRGPWKAGLWGAVSRQTLLAMGSVGSCLPTEALGKGVCGELSPDRRSWKWGLWGAVSRQRPLERGLWGAVSRQKPLERGSVGSCLPTVALGKEVCGELSPDRGPWTEGLWGAASRQWHLDRESVGSCIPTGTIGQGVCGVLSPDSDLGVLLSSYQCLAGMHNQLTRFETQKGTIKPSNHQ